MARQFKNVSTGTVETVENDFVADLMERSDNYEEVKAEKPVEKTKK